MKYSAKDVVAAAERLVNAEPARSGARSARPEPRPVATRPPLSQAQYRHLERETRSLPLAVRATWNTGLGRVLLTIAGVYTVWVLLPMLLFWGLVMGWIAWHFFHG